MTVKRRKSRVEISHEAVVYYCVLHPKADSGQVAKHFGVHVRTAQKHMRTLQRFVE
jgi:hypothetical protein